MERKKFRLYFVEKLRKFTCFFGQLVVKCENVILSFNTFFGRLVDILYYRYLPVPYIDRKKTSLMVGT